MHCVVRDGVVTTLMSSLVLILLAGCAGPIPAPIAGQACIKGAMATPGAILLDNAVHATLLKDGDSYGGLDRQCFAPGEVTLQISAQIPPLWSTACVTFPMADAHEYRTRAVLKDKTFVYDIVDVTHQGMDGPVVRQIVMPVGSHDCGARQTRTPRLN